MTALFLLGILLVVAGYDLLTLRNRGVESTISRLLRRWARRGARSPTSAFAMGCLLGHFFL